MTGYDMIIYELKSIILNSYLALLLLKDNSRSCISLFFLSSPKITLKKLFIIIKTSFTKNIKILSDIAIPSEFFNHDIVFRAFEI